MTKLSGVLIAAGQSRRFGGDKLLHPMHDGTPLALAAFRNLRPVCGEVVAVLRPDQERLACLLWDEGARIVVSEDSHAGMGHSLAAGVRACADAQGWLLSLADMPYVQTATMQRVADAILAGASIAAPVHQAQRGHPVGFSKKWFAQLAGLIGDSGARALLQAHADEVTLVSCLDDGIHRDIDTPADLLTV
ncbi:MAG: nucleotidyltransferase family protein [Rhodocyclaceae bacterium]|nr:nucleotidyltransferase family protein [Rhodocyclaceae bacterium]